MFFSRRVNQFNSARTLTLFVYFFSNCLPDNNVGIVIQYFSNMPHRVLLNIVFDLSPNVYDGYRLLLRYF